MAKKKALTELSDSDLLAALAEYKEELFNLRFQLVTGQLDNNSRIPAVPARCRPGHDRAACP